MALALDSKTKSEIDDLITYVEKSGVRFIRSGTEYSAAEGAAHLRKKLSAAGDRVKTTEDFIDGIASKSYLNGKLYQVKFADGHTQPLEILVVNDDGYSAAGIDAVVEGLRTLPGVHIDVVAPATNQSGSGDKTTPGGVTAFAAQTQSGYPATAVNGYPADSVLYALIKWLVKGAWLPNSQADVFLHPTAKGAWAGLLVTMINLLPIGQLDGGHIATAYFGNRYNRFAERLRRLLPAGGLIVFFWVLFATQQEAQAAWNLPVGMYVATFAALPWVIWFLMVGLMRRLSGGVNHPPVDDEPLPRSRRALFWLMVVVFVGVFMPVPLRPMVVGPPQQAADAPISASLEP